MALTRIARESPLVYPSRRRNNGQTTWTYNQGIVLSGLSKLYSYTGNTSFLHAAQHLLDSVLASPLVDSSILVESCDPSRTCDEDQWMFKGVFFEHLMYFMKDIVVSRHSDLSTKRRVVRKYGKFIHANAQAVWNIARDPSNGTIGNWWAGPPAEQVNRQFGVETTGSGVAAIYCDVLVEHLLQALAPEHDDIPNCKKTNK
jgi:predicted alpha-1,6-mannanase (GH76 family)